MGHRLEPERERDRVSERALTLRNETYSVYINVYVYIQVHTGFIAHYTYKRSMTEATHTVYLPRPHCHTPKQLDFALSASDVTQTKNLYPQAL